MVSESTTNISRILITAVPKQNYAETLSQKIKSPRKLFSLILKLNHMLYKHDIEDRSDTNYWKIWICISYKTHSGSNNHGSTSFMRDNM